MGVIASARKVRFMGASWDTGNIAVTTRRMIMVRMTQAMLNAAIAEAQAKAEGRRQKAKDSRLEYMIAEDDHYVNLLKQVDGERVHMPSGKRKLGPSRIRFF